MHVFGFYFCTIQFETFPFEVICIELMTISSKEMLMISLSYEKDVIFKGWLFCQNNYITINSTL